MDPYYVISLYLVAFILIWVLAILFKDKLKLDVNGPLIMRRTGRLRGLIDSIAQKSPRFWKVLMNIGIPVAVFFMGYTLYAILQASTMIFQSPQVVPILPGVDYAGNPFFLPLGYGLIGLVTVIFIHEFAHGILARAEGVKIKSIGVLLFTIIPGAFVEPDEEEVKKLSRLEKIRIYAAGSIFNIGTAAIAIGILFALTSFLIPAAFHSDGIVITSVVPKSPSDGVLKEGMAIYNVNGQNVKNLTDYVNIRTNSKIGDELTLITNQGTFKIKLTANPNNSTAPYAGFRPDDHLIVNQNVANTYGDVLPWILFYLKELFFWIGFLNLAIGTINLLPMKPLDGGLILEELLGYKLPEETVRPIVNTVSYILIAILVVNIAYAIGRGILLNLPV